MAYNLYKLCGRHLCVLSLISAFFVMAEPARIVAQPLTGQMVTDLLDSWQDAKLARDLYAHVSEKFRHPVLENIGLSEKRHMREMGALLIAIGQKDALDSILKPPGEFADTLLRQMYVSLTLSGDSSVIKSLRAGAYLEEMLTDNLNRCVKRTPESDIRQAFRKLKQASEEHLRAFYQALQFKGQTYQPAILKQEEFDRIIQ